jgi:hypothetical protein
MAAPSASPLGWFPRLLNGTSQQRAEVQIGIGGLHWEELDEASRSAASSPDMGI